MDELENVNMGIACGKCQQQSLLITTCEIHHFILASICENPNCENHKSIYVVENGCPECFNQIYFSAVKETAARCYQIARGLKLYVGAVEIADAIKKEFNIDGQGEKESGDQ